MKSGCQRCLRHHGFPMELFCWRSSGFRCMFLGQKVVLFFFLHSKVGRLINLSPFGSLYQQELFRDGIAGQILASILAAWNRKLPEPNTDETG